MYTGCVKFAFSEHSIRVVRIHDPHPDGISELCMLEQVGATDCRVVGPHRDLLEKLPGSIHVHGILKPRHVVTSLSFCRYWVLVDGRILDGFHIL